MQVELFGSGDALILALTGQLLKCCTDLQHSGHAEATVEESLGISQQLTQKVCSWKSELSTTHQRSINPCMAVPSLSTISVAGSASVNGSY